MGLLLAETLSQMAAFDCSSWLQATPRPPHSSRSLEKSATGELGDGGGGFRGEGVVQLPDST